MSKVKIISTSTGYGSKLIVDDQQITHYKGITFNHFAGATPKIYVEIPIFQGCEIDAEGKVYFDGYFVNDQVARHVYEKLKEKFENEKNSID